MYVLGANVIIYFLSANFILINNQIYNGKTILLMSGRQHFSTRDILDLIFASSLRLFSMFIDSLASFFASFLSCIVFILPFAL